MPPPVLDEPYSVNRSYSLHVVGDFQFA